MGKEAIILHEDQLGGEGWDFIICCIQSHMLLGSSLFSRTHHFSTMRLPPLGLRSSHHVLKMNAWRGTSGSFMEAAPKPSCFPSYLCIWEMEGMDCMKATLIQAWLQGCKLGTLVCILCRLFAHHSNQSAVVFPLQIFCSNSEIVNP